MNRDIRDKWVAALRSGTYRQGKGVLRRRQGAPQSDEFCCLGVLCELAVEAGVADREADHAWTSTIEYGDPRSTTDRSRHSLPGVVQRWAGLDSPDGNLHSVGDGPMNLILANDSGMPFTAIADLIERYL